MARNGTGCESVVQDMCNLLETGQEHAPEGTYVSDACDDGAI